MGVSAPVVCLQDVLSNALSDGNLQLDDQHVSADRLQSAAVGQVESAGESSGKTRPRIGGCSCSWEGGCSRNYHPVTVTASSCPRPPGSRLTLQRPFALGELFIHQTGPLATGQLMILPPQWDTLSLSAVTLEGEDRYIRSQSWFWELKSQDPETASGLLRWHRMRVLWPPPSSSPLRL